MARFVVRENLVMLELLALMSVSWLLAADDEKEEKREEREGKKISLFIKTCIVRNGCCLSSEKALGGNSSVEWRFDAQEY